MAVNRRANQRVPPSPHHTDDNEERQDMYGDCCRTWETCEMGTLKTEYRNVEEDKNGDVWAGITGHFWHHYQNEDGQDGTQKQITAEVHPAQHRFRCKGSCNVNGQNRETVSGATDNRGSIGENSQTTTENSLHGSTKNRVAIYKDETRLATKSNYTGASDTTMGVRNTDGDNWSHGNKRAVDTRGDLDYGIIKGDWGRHVQGDGAADFRVENKDFQLQTGDGGGTLRLTSRKGDIKGDANKNVDIKAGQKITLTVGQSSITIEDGKITLKASQIILDGETHAGGQGGDLLKKCNDSCTTKVFGV